MAPTVNTSSPPQSSKSASFKAPLSPIAASPLSPLPPTQQPSSNQSSTPSGASSPSFPSSPLLSPTRHAQHPVPSNPSNLHHQITSASSGQQLAQSSTTSPTSGQFPPSSSSSAVSSASASDAGGAQAGPASPPLPAIRPGSGWPGSRHHSSGGGGLLSGGSALQSGITSRNISRKPSISSFVGGMSAGSTVPRPDYSEAKIVVAMVGLPARGKSFLSNKLQRYLRWLEYEVKVFNVGVLRRSIYKRRAQRSGKKEDQSAAFFDHSNADASAKREKIAEDCLEELITWLKAGGNVGIHDATNSSRARRKKIEERVRREPGLKLIFIESICTDPDIITTNIRHKVSSGDPDYDGMPTDQAEADFRARIKHYEETYQSIDPEKGEGHLTWARFFNVGHQVQMNMIDGYLQSRIVFYLMNLHITPRSIFFTRHGESAYNVEGKIGGDSGLSPRGMKYASALPKLIKDSIGDAPLTVWTSTLKRTIQTAEHLPYEKKTWKSLDELDAGVCDGMTYEEIEEEYPEDYAARDDDKFNYRYRGGESYRDVVVRLEPVILELERQENILVVCHQAVLRCLYAYFHGLSQDELPYIKIPLHTVIKLTPKAYLTNEQRFRLPIEAVDTTRPRPTKLSEEIMRQKRQQSLDELPPSLRPPPQTQQPA